MAQTMDRASVLSSTTRTRADFQARPLWVPVQWPASSGTAPGVWATRFTCGAGHIHQERVGPLKSDAVRVYYERRARAHAGEGWCPAIERRNARERVRLEAERHRKQVTFREYVRPYIEYSMPGSAAARDGKPPAGGMVRRQVVDRNPL
jgi:hypothetical protein